MRRFRFAIFGCLALVAAAAPALAVEPAPGSKNFQPPNSVPNYFSNEAGPFRGGAGAETTYSSSGPMVVSPYAPARVAAAPTRSARHQVARGKSRTRLAQARSRSSRHAAQIRIAKAKAAAVRTAHAQTKPSVSKKPGATKTAAAKKPAPTRTAAAKKPAAKAAAKKQAPERTRPAGKDRRTTHTASR